MNGTNYLPTEKKKKIAVVRGCPEVWRLQPCRQRGPLRLPFGCDKESRRTVQHAKHIREKEEFYETKFSVFLIPPHGHCIM